MIEYSKENIKELCSSLAGLTTDVDAHDTDNWTYGYIYNHAGVREQKRLLTSPHGDGLYSSESLTKVFAHKWNIIYTFRPVRN